MKNDCQRNKSSNWLADVLTIAEKAGAATVEIQQNPPYRIESKLDNSPVTEADLLAHQLIEEGLLALEPTIPVLSEEGHFIPSETRLAWPRFWLVDPLDGTRAFIQGSDEFTINIALIENHIPVLGVVAVPKRGELYWAVRGGGAYWKQQGGEAQLLTARKTSGVPKKVTVSRFSLTERETNPEWHALLERLGPHEFYYCSSSLKICLVAKGEADLYPRLGTTYEWDLAAGHCILEEAGGQMLNLKGETLRYNLASTLENLGFYAISGCDLIPVCCG